MKTLSESLNFSQNREVHRAVKIRKFWDTDFHETILCYCAENDIDVHAFDDNDIASSVYILQDYAKGEPYAEHFYFWI